MHRPYRHIGRCHDLQIHDADWS